MIRMQIKFTTQSNKLRKNLGKIDKMQYGQASAEFLFSLALFLIVAILIINSLNAISNSLFRFSQSLSDKQAISLISLQQGILYSDFRCTFIPISLQQGFFSSDSHVIRGRYGQTMMSINPTGKIYTPKEEMPY